MTRDINPYSPPTLDVPHQSWWSRLLGVFTPRLAAKQCNFRDGDAMIYGGIAFFIDPNDHLTLYAGSQSTDYSDERFALIAREAIRHLPEFLAVRGGASPALEDRRLVVRIVNDYTGIVADYSRPVEVVPAPLSESLPQTNPENIGEPNECNRAAKSGVLTMEDLPSPPADRRRYPLGEVNAAQCESTGRYRTWVAYSAFSRWLHFSPSLSSVDTFINPMPIQQ